MDKKNRQLATDGLIHWGMDKERQRIDYSPIQFGREPAFTLPYENVGIGYKGYTIVLHSCPKMSQLQFFSANAPPLNNLTYNCPLIFLLLAPNLRRVLGTEEIGAELQNASFFSKINIYMASSLQAPEFQPFFQHAGPIDYSERKSSYCGPVILVILLHLVLLYYILQSTSNIFITPKVKGEKVALLYLPPAAKIDLPKPPQPIAKPPVARTVTARASTAPVYIPPPFTINTITPPPPPPEEDMMARVEAARKRRAEQATELAQAAPSEAVEDDNQRALRIARANFASSQKRGDDKEDSGGVFQIKNQTFHSAEFTFRGWNATMRRMWPQQYVVEQGQESDIEIAIVKKMIEVIRKYKDGDFIWESHRMGRQVTLSARVADTAQLQQFLLREFFPNYRQSVNH